MRNLNDFEYLLKLIDKRIESKMSKQLSPIAKVDNCDGVFVDCSLVYAVDGISKLKKVPIVQSPNFHYSIKSGDTGLLLNTGLIPSGFFSTGSIATKPIEANHYVFLPLTTKVASATLKKDNIIIQDSEGTNSIKLEQSGAEMKFSKALTVESSEGITLTSKSTIDMSGTALDLNGAKIGQILQDLFDAIVQGIQTASDIPVPMNSNWSAGWRAGKLVAEGAWKPKLEAFKQKIK